MRIKDEKYYSEDGTRRASSRYAYLGDSNKCALTWYSYDNGIGIKYAIVFDNNIAMRRYMLENRTGGFAIEFKHISKPRQGIELIDYNTGEPLYDHYRTDNKYIINRKVKDESKKIQKEIDELIKSIKGVNAPWLIAPVETKINALKQKLDEIKPVKKKEESRFKGLTQDEMNRVKQYEQETGREFDPTIDIVEYL